MWLELWVSIWALVLSVQSYVPAPFVVVVSNISLFVGAFSAEGTSWLSLAFLFDV